ncbi:MAG: hypothetical protein H6733_10100 [Alphaproteobacteria bacterium]|nr:hypothetical protein [Alphaproteobacteria bacterium]
MIDTATRTTAMTLGRDLVHARARAWTAGGLHADGGNVHAARGHVSTACQSTYVAQTRIPEIASTVGVSIPAEVAVALLDDATSDATVAAIRMGAATATEASRG